MSWSLAPLASKETRQPTDRSSSLSSGDLENAGYWLLALSEVDEGGQSTVQYDSEVIVQGVWRGKASNSSKSLFLEGDVPTSKTCLCEHNVNVLL